MSSTVHHMLLRVKLANHPGTLAKLLKVIADQGGTLGAIDLISSDTEHIIRELLVNFHDSRSMEEIRTIISDIPEIELLQVADRVFLRHVGGKIEVNSIRPISDRIDLSLVYTPGVGKISEMIAEDPDLAYTLTIKGNTVAIVTDGTAVLGLGNLGPAAALPVMEGKAALFKQFANVNAMPICLDAKSPQEIIDTVVALAPTFGGINLEDIAAPQCFEIEEKLRELIDIPVFHDDQHGTAIVTLAGLINALKVVGKHLVDVKIVINGAGAAGVAIAKILLSAGAKNIISCDRKGAISRDVEQTVDSKRWLAEHTNPECQHGSTRDILKGADIVIGVSGPGLITREDVANMAAKPIVFALANPVPEIYPDQIYDIAGVVATGRSDFPNQINNALAFPGIFRGALDCSASTINEAMCLAAAHALASIVKEQDLSPENIIPSIFNPEVAPAVAKAVIQAAKETGVTRDLPRG